MVLKQLDIHLEKNNEPLLDFTTETKVKMIKKYIKL